VRTCRVVSVDGSGRGFGGVGAHGRSPQGVGLVCAVTAVTPLTCGVTAVTDGCEVPGHRIPSVREMADHWNVARTTAARALKTLQAEGLIESTTGSGSIVAAPSAPTAEQTQDVVSDGRAV
jgi:Bacterial regulatory proteins, gntR family